MHCKYKDTHRFKNKRLENANTNLKITDVRAKDLLGIKKLFHYNKGVNSLRGA